MSELFFSSLKFGNTAGSLTNSVVEMSRRFRHFDENWKKEFTVTRFYRGIFCAAMICLTTAVVAEVPDIEDTKSLEAFVDGVMETSMRNNHTAGAVVAIMVNDNIVLAKGYGYSDVANKVSVDPATTMFRIGSVSKLFTYTALMQLHEQGKLDLEANIQDYLDNLEIPETFPEPIKVKHLFTHTAGFEERVIGLFAKDKTRATSLQDLLADDLPERVRKPGLVSSYSNHSLGIAGLIIENITGMSWADYVRRYILDPLNMQFATAHQPVPENLSQHSSVGYRWINGEFEAQGFEFVPLASAGTMSASAIAMTRFMKAHLQGGIVDGTRILKDATTVQMHSPLFKVHDSLNAWLYGFSQSSINGLNMLGHTGGLSSFITNFVLMPDQNVGIFVSTNTTGAGEVIDDFTTSFFDHYFPFEPDITPLENPSDLTSIVGDYVTFRHPVTSLLKFIGYTNVIKVVSNEPGHLKILSETNDPKFAVEIEPMVFQLTDSSTRLYFDSDEYGQQRMFYGHAGGSLYKLAPLDSLQLHMTLAIISSALFLWAFIAWPIQRLISTRQTSVPEHRSRLSLWWLTIAVFLSLLGLVTNVSEDIVFGMTDDLELVLTFTYLIPALSLLSIYSVIRLATDEGTEPHIKFFHFVLVISGLLVCWQFSYWNLLGT